MSSVVGVVVVTEAVAAAVASMVAAIGTPQAGGGKGEGGGYQ